MRVNHALRFPIEVLKPDFGTSLDCMSAGPKCIGCPCGPVRLSSFKRFHCLTYVSAMSLSSTRMPLFSCVQRPVVAQLVLPVQTMNGLVGDFAKTTNLLCPRPSDQSMRRVKSIPTRSGRAALLLSSPFFFLLPLESTTCARCFRSAR